MDSSIRNYDIKCSWFHMELYRYYYAPAGDFSLSIRSEDKVKHYRIRKMDNQGGFFVTRRAIFNTIPELVEHYRHEADGLCTNLR